MAIRMEGPKTVGACLLLAGIAALLIGDGVLRNSKSAMDEPASAGENDIVLMLQMKKEVELGVAKREAVSRTSAAHAIAASATTNPEAATNSSAPAPGAELVVTTALDLPPAEDMPPAPGGEEMLGGLEPPPLQDMPPLEPEHLAQLRASLNTRAALDQDMDDFGFDEATWEGLELMDVPNAEVQNATGFVNASGTYDPSYPTVTILGLHNTGTNLLQKLLTKNFPGLYPGLYVEGGDTECDRGLKIWKHTKPEHIVGQLQSRGQMFALKDIVTVAALRDPMSWLTSMKKAPYDFGGCMNHARWATSPCTFPAPGGYGSKVNRKCTLSHASSFHLDNIEDAWNGWNSDYSNLASMGFGPSVVVSYEEMVLDTQAVLGRIAAAMGKPAPATVKQQHAPAKSHGTPHGRMMAIRKLQTKSYMSGYTDMQVHQVCDRLKTSLMHQYSYNDCDSVR